MDGMRDERAQHRQPHAPALVALFPEQQRELVSENRRVAPARQREFDRVLLRQMTHDPEHVLQDPHVIVHGVPARLLVRHPAIEFRGARLQVLDMLRPLEQVTLVEAIGRSVRREVAVEVLQRRAHATVIEGVALVRHGQKQQAAGLEDAMPLGERFQNVGDVFEHVIHEASPMEPWGSVHCR
jgi:hypothetical protein